MPIRYTKRKLKKVARTILQLNDTPESIALGVALGLFVGLTPTMGIQILEATIITTLFRANRIAGIMMVFITNPFTFVPIYWLDYRIGVALLGMNPMGLRKFEELMHFEQAGFFRNFFQFIVKLFGLGWDIVGPMFLGGAVLGLIVGAISYPLTLRFVRRERELKRRIHELRMKRKAERARRKRARARGNDSEKSGRQEAKETTRNPKCPEESP
jgi:uncharacterized protein (DUF2062 family)